MIRRALFAFAVCAATAHAATETFQRDEAFREGPPKSWQYFHPNQGFGFFPTSSNGNGEAGGFFFPKTYTAYYADTALNGSFNRGTPVTASGTLRLDEISFDPNYTNTAYIAHFRKGSTSGMFVNILGISLTGNNQGAILCAPIVQFSNGRAFVGNAIKLPVDSTPLPWSYEWDPTAGGNSLGQLKVTIDGKVSTLTLNRLSGGIDYTLDAFGLYQPAFAAPNSNSFLTFFIDKISYTVLTGPAPKIKVKGPRKIRITGATASFSGTTRTTGGNRVTAVRYRIRKDTDPPARFKKARGTANWTAKIRIPTGTTTFEFKAVGDNGRSSSFKTVRVTRTP